MNDISVPVGEALKVLRRGLGWGLAAAVVLGYLAYVWSARQTPVYESEATVLASSATPDYRSFGVSPVVAPAIDVSAYQVASRSASVMADAVVALGSQPTDDAVRALRGNSSVTSTAAGTSSLLQISARSGLPML